MLEVLDIKTLLDNLSQNKPSTSLEDNAIYQAKVDTASWAYNNGELRSLEELITKFHSIQEEILVYEFADEQGYQYKAAQGKLEVIKTVLACANA